MIVDSDQTVLGSHGESLSVLRWIYPLCQIKSFISLSCLYFKSIELHRWNYNWVKYKSLCSNKSALEMKARVVAVFSNHTQIYIRAASALILSQRQQTKEGVLKLVVQYFDYFQQWIEQK